MYTLNGTVAQQAGEAGEFGIGALAGELIGAAVNVGLSFAAGAGMSAIQSSLAKKEAQLAAKIEAQREEAARKMTQLVGEEQRKTLETQTKAQISTGNASTDQQIRLMQESAKLASLAPYQATGVGTDISRWSGFPSGAPAPATGALPPGAPPELQLMMLQQQAAEEEKKEAEKKKKKTRTIMYAVGGGLAALAIGGVVIYAVTKD